MSGLAMQRIPALSRHPVLRASASRAPLTQTHAGTAVALYGYFPTSAAGYPASVSYSVALDGTATTNYASALAPDADPAKSLLAAFADLTYGEHSVSHLFLQRAPHEVLMVRAKWNLAQVALGEL